MRAMIIPPMAAPGVAYFSFHGNEYFIATNNNMETAVSSHDAIVELVGIANIHHAAKSLSGHFRPDYKVF
jgi:hypothetical protein